MTTFLIKYVNTVLRIPYTTTYTTQESWMPLFIQVYLHKLDV